MDPYDITKKTWNKIAELYEEKFMDLHIYDPTYKQFLSHLNQEDAKILDIGCGPGNILKYLQSANPRLQLEGLDSSENMIHLAKKNTKHVNFHLMDIRDIHKLNTTYDGIIAGFIIPYLIADDLTRFLQSCSNLLNAGACLYLSYAEGNPKHSGFQTGSTGDKTYFSYYESDQLIKNAEAKNFICLDRMIVQYQRTSENSEHHSIIILRKK